MYIVDDFIVKLLCNGEIGMKVVLIFGNIGDGKLYILNYIFFGG